MEEIILLTDEELDKKYNINVRGMIISCIKHIRRYGYEKLPKDLWLRILFYSLKGYDCNEDHLDITQRIRLYRYFEDKDVDDPYIQQFIKETKEKHKNALL